MINFKPKTKYLASLASIAVLVVAGLGIWYLMDNKAIQPTVDSSGWGNPEYAPKLEELELDANNWRGVNVGNYGFSFRFPKDFKIGTFPDEAGVGSYIVVQEPSKRQGFQIYIRPFDEDISMTPERIKRDIADIKIQKAQEVRFEKLEKTGLAFLSDNEAFNGASREVWFTHNGNLYQISTYASLDPLLQAVLKTWRFE